MTLKEEFWLATGSILKIMHVGGFLGGSLSTAITSMGVILLEMFFSIFFNFVLLRLKQRLSK